MIVPKSPRQPAGDREAKSQTDKEVRGRPGGKAGVHAAKISGDVRDGHCIAPDIGKNDNMSKAERDIEQEKAPTAQPSEVNLAHFTLSLAIDENFEIPDGSR